MSKAQDSETVQAALGKCEGRWGVRQNLEKQCLIGERVLLNYTSIIKMIHIL